MRYRRSLPILVAMVALLTASPVAAADNQPPQAAAGLDQQVTSGTTVYLDAGGSDDPDGTVENVTWSIQAPNGSTITPSCRRCTTPTFTPETTGRWTATVTVTDDSGATATDTLYVTVDAPRGPSLSVTTPDTAVEGQPTPITLDTEADSADLRTVGLYRNGTRLDQTAVSGRRASVSLSHTFSNNGTKELRATVTDDDGYVNTTTVSVDVVAPSAVTVSSLGGGGGFTPTCDDPAAERVYRNGEHGSVCSASDMIIDMQGGGRAVAIRTAALETGIRLYQRGIGKVVNMTSPEQARELKREAGDSAIPIEKVNKVFRKNMKIGIIDNQNRDRIKTIEENAMIEEYKQLQNTETASTKPVSGLNRKERIADHVSSGITDTSCCPNGYDTASPRPSNRKKYNSNMAPRDSITESSTDREDSHDSTTDFASNSEKSTDNTGCPPPQVGIPSPVEQKLC